jgi:hypothetical protein
MHLSHGVLALALLLAAPARASAGPALRLALLDPEPAPRAHLDLPPLELGALAPFDEGGGAPARGQRVEPALALILGIIPGFGIGHLLAGSPQWTIWLIADIVIFIVWPGGFFVTESRAYDFLGLLVLVERLFEGISAYQAAGGTPIFRDLRASFEGPPSPAQLAMPLASPRAALP